VRTARKAGGAAPSTHVARHLTLRELFHDWEHEDALELAIEPLDEPRAAGPLDAAARRARAPPHGRDRRATR
jgi:hypothetical protein